MRCIAAFLISLPVLAAQERPATVYQVYEVALEAASAPALPLADPPRVLVKGPHMEHRLQLFWDGEKTWKFRVMPLAAGRYTWTVAGSQAGLGGRQGAFEAVANANPAHDLDRLGPPWVARSRRHFAHADGTPWFWLADTAWNGALLATREEWEEYLEARKRQRFTAIQVVTTQWRGAMGDGQGRAAFQWVNGKLSVDPEFFRRMDERIAAINRHGMVAVPVILWALTGPTKESPGESLSSEDCILLASYIRARYHSYHVLWFLGGDGDYRGEKAEKWRQIGRAVFPSDLDKKPATLHPRGLQDPWPGLKDEPWLDFLVYQSGHGANADKWRWIAGQGMAAGAKLEPVRPVLDSEPNYEGHSAYRTQIRINDGQVRRAVYMGLLAAPPAGVTYGAHGIWPWTREPAQPVNHRGSGKGDHWRDCLRYPGGQQMKIVRDHFDRIDWPSLRPAQELVPNQTVDAEFSNYVAAARTEAGDSALVYTPKHQTLVLDLTSFKDSLSATWLNPRDGQALPAGRQAPRSGVRLTPPADGDWLLLLANRP